MLETEIQDSKEVEENVSGHNLRLSATINCTPNLFSIFNATFIW